MGPVVLVLLEPYDVVVVYDVVYTTVVEELEPVELKESDVVVDVVAILGGGLHR